MCLDSVLTTLTNATTSFFCRCTGSLVASMSRSTCLTCRFLSVTLDARQTRAPAAAALRHACCFTKLFRTRRFVVVTLAARQTRAPATAAFSHACCVKTVCCMSSCLLLHKRVPAIAPCGHTCHAADPCATSCCMIGDRSYVVCPAPARTSCMRPSHIVSSSHKSLVVTEGGLLECRATVRGLHLQAAPPPHWRLSVLGSACSL
jgi:hypothetical protein